MMEGGCACGAVRYRLKSAPMIVHCCHCRDCQRQTGSAFVINVLIETDIPHPTCLYPAPTKHLADVLGHLDEGVRRRVLQDNAAELYGIAVPTPTA